MQLHQCYEIEKKKPLNDCNHLGAVRVGVVRGTLQFRDKPTGFNRACCVIRTGLSRDFRCRRFLGGTPQKGGDHRGTASSFF